MTYERKSLRMVGYIGKKGRATVYPWHGRFQVVVNSRFVVEFDSASDADLYAVSVAHGPIHRMGA